MGFALGLGNAVIDPLHPRAHRAGEVQVGEQVGNGLGGGVAVVMVFVLLGFAVDGDGHMDAPHAAIFGRLRRHGDAGEM